MKHVSLKIKFIVHHSSILYFFVCVCIYYLIILRTQLNSLLCKAIQVQESKFGIRYCVCWRFQLDWQAIPLYCIGRDGNKVVVISAFVHVYLRKKFSYIYHELVCKWDKRYLIKTFITVVTMTAREPYFNNTNSVDLPIGIMVRSISSTQRFGMMFI